MTKDVTISRTIKIENGQKMTAEFVIQSDHFRKITGEAVLESYDDQIRKVVIKEGITEIGNFNFMKCKNLESVQLPSSLKKIWERAFWKCESLKEIKIPDSVEVIATRAFSSCGRIREAASRKGMDESQITGATSSYARKYALNGLLLIDDNKDADHLDNSDSSRVTTLNDEQLANIEALVDEVKANVPKLLAAYGVKALKDIPAINYLKLMHQLETKRSQAA